jgi:glycine cleavage system transcriptional repressor
MTMRNNLVFTLTGPDRIGIVEDVTQVLLAHAGNVETSRMVRLGGEFAILMLVSIPADQIANLNKDFESLIAEGYQIATSQTDQTYAEQHRGWLSYQIELQGADHEGIVHEVAHYLSQRGINIESMDTALVPAPMSGAPLFTMTAQVVVPPDQTKQDWVAALEGVGHHMNVDIKVSAANS